jgi:gp16 family phage-associated protein
MTTAQFKALLRRQGKTIRQWAEENSFPPEAVYRALNGVEKGNFGRAHEILVRAGIKQFEQLAA